MPTSRPGYAFGPGRGLRQGDCAPVIGLRHWGSTEEEIASPMQGDEFVTSPNQVGTRSVTINSEPDLVFDFIAQMGFGRAGWYSYDWLDNLGRRSATSINQAWQVRSAGEIVPAGSISFVAVVVERPTRFVLHVPTRRFAGHQVDFTLSYLLSRIDSSTRLVSRVQIAITGPLGPLLSTALLMGDGLMVRKQLLGLKQRCERRRLLVATEKPGPAERPTNAIDIS